MGLDMPRSGIGSSWMEDFDSHLGLIPQIAPIVGMPFFWAVRRGCLALENRQYSVAAISEDLVALSLSLKMLGLFSSVSFSLVGRS